MKLTRDELFQKTFFYIIDSLGIEHAELELTTKNKSENTHRYIMHIPQYYVDYTIESYTKDGVFHEQEDHHKKQLLPKNHRIKSTFDRFYAKYQKTVDDELKSYVDIFDWDIQNDSYMYNIEKNGCIVAYIDVVYMRNYLPFPNFETVEKDVVYLEKELIDLNKTVDQMKFDIDVMSEEIDMVNEVNRKLSRKTVNVIQQNNSQMDRMKTVMRAMYNENENCPVCFETIQKTNLTIPNCCHFICNICSDKCTNCPICRLEYKNINMMDFAVCFENSQV